MLVCYYNEYLSGDRLFDSPSLEKARAEVIQTHEKSLETMAEPIRAKGTTVTTSVVCVEGRYRRQGHAPSFVAVAGAPVQHGLEPDPDLSDAALVG